MKVLKILFASLFCIICSTAWSQYKILYSDDIDQETNKEKKLILKAFIQDDKWQYLSDNMDYLNLSEIGRLSETALLKLQSMNIGTLIISDLSLDDYAIKYLPKELNILDISNNMVSLNGIDTFVSRDKKLQRIYAQGTFISHYALQQYNNDLNIEFISSRHTLESKNCEISTQIKE